MKLNKIELTDFEEQIYDMGVIRGIVCASLTAIVTFALRDYLNPENDRVKDIFIWGVMFLLMLIFDIIKTKNLQVDDEAL